jgi:uncharacterized protein with NRDE domain
MCLIAWNWQPGGDTPLLLIANRDEFYARPTEALDWWPGALILGGRDLQAGGTWLGVGRSGRLAALTNYRDPAGMRADAPSRGELVSLFLSGELSAMDYLNQLTPLVEKYNPFNLLVYDGQRLLGLESRSARILTIPPGVGAVSNADFETPWPKLVKLKSRLSLMIDQGRADDQHLLGMLHDDDMADDDDVPDTGLTPSLELALSAVFVKLPDYGTRACSVVRIGRQDIRFLEQVFDATGLLGQKRVQAQIRTR